MVSNRLKGLRLTMRITAALASAMLASALRATPPTDNIITPIVASMDTAVRTTQLLTDGWHFKLDPAVSGPEQVGFDDAGWATVSVPHTWNRVGYYRSDPSSHLNTQQAINKTQGVGWYRLSFNAPQASTGKRAWLQFDAASRIAEVWLNGIKLGVHNGGFSRFRLDATAALKPGEANLLAVRVDNAKPEANSSTADVLPLTGDFFVHGGLYRPVSLIATDAVHLDMFDHGGSGVHATTFSLNGDRAMVNVSARVRNDKSRSEKVTIISQLQNTDGQVAAQTMQKLNLPANGEQSLMQVLNLMAAHLWNGVADPYLYTLVVEVRGHGDKVLDRVAQPFGVRQMAFDPARGFMLNGKPYSLHGVGYHQDREGKGWAISSEDVASDLATIREMGANTIRLTHYQHGQPVHDIADRMGFVVWDEIPLVSQWTMGGAKVASPSLIDNARQQLAEEIAQNGNHASVATWSIANEVDFGNSLPAFVTGSTGTPPDPAPLLRDLNGTAHALDSSRPTAIATCCEGRLFATGVEVPVTAPEADLAGANRYFGWYYGKSSDLGPSLDALHAKRPNQPLALTEYGAGGATNIHTDDPTATPADSRGRVQPEEVESLVHEQNWAQIATRPYLWATWLWSAFDFASTVRHEGDAEDINTKGLVEYDHKTRKDAWYFYKANWADTPTVHITSSRYVERAYPVTEVKVYSNAPVTILRVNGRTIGEMADCPLRICVWPKVQLDPGKDSIEAEGRFASSSVTDRVDWHLDETTARGLLIDSGALVAATSASGRFGSDTFFDGGDSGSTDKPADYGKPAQPAVIAGTGDRDSAATFRHGNFSYHVPVTPGRYTVRLTFIEPSASPGERLFDVTANGKLTVRRLDIAKEAGKQMMAIQRSFEIDAKGSMIDLAFTPTKGEAIISAIEIVPSSRN